MADLDALIRLRKHSVDEKQKVLADLYRKAEIIETEKETLKQRIEDERKALNQMDERQALEATAYYGRFANAIRADMDRLDVDLSKLETRIDIAREDMRSAFADLKRVEIVQRNREEEEAKTEAAKETTELNDIAMETFRRRDGEDS